MAGTRKLEIVGFVTIAVALHVATAAVIMPEQIAMGAAIQAPPAQVSAGSGSMSELVNQWETPPETVSEPEQSQPQELSEPELQRPEPEEMPDMAPETPAAPQLAAAKPNLPEPPAPAPVDPVLPELRKFEPPVIKSELALDQSTRPESRPVRRQPEPQRQAQPEPRSEPVQQQQPQRQAQQPAQSGGGAGGSAQASSAGGGSGGVSQQQKQSLLSQWGGSISSCIARRAGRVRGVESGVQVSLSVNVARSGVIQGIGIAGSSGIAEADQAAASAAQRAGRCPAAPAGLTDASYPFVLPIIIR